MYCDIFTLALWILFIISRTVVLWLFFTLPAENIPVDISVIKCYCFPWLIGSVSGSLYTCVFIFSFKFFFSSSQLQNGLLSYWQLTGHNICLPFSTTSAVFTSEIHDSTRVHNRAHQGNNVPLFSRCTAMGPTCHQWDLVIENLTIIFSLSRYWQIVPAIYNIHQYITNRRLRFTQTIQSFRTNI